MVLLVAALILYVLLWPVPVDPVAWQAPPSPGYVGPFAPNTRLGAIETLPIGDNHGPEDVVLDGQGRIYAATHEGRIVRLEPDGSRPENWVTTGGRPLGIRVDRDGNVIVADAFRGLLKITPDRQLTVLAAEAGGKPILYANGVDVAADGRIYFSDASTKFGARQWGGTYGASLLDILEHGGHGRLLVYDPVSGKATTLLGGLNFANGVAVGHDQTYVLVAETGSYRVLRYWIAGPRRGRTEVLIDNLPGFPDNLSTGLDGRFWVALISPRNTLVDRLADKPFLRRAVQRLPGFLRPKAVSYGHVVAFDGWGRALASLQDPEGRYRLNTAVVETKDFLYIGSLVMPALGRLPKGKAGL
ncbi:MAG TPA: SMP-30/gluconolactonase/LRE family protein [Methylomirabilota bacterium]|nr:SMP-30/gluconolactonase/LRE family protein [Methylomirabilota bacterium]